MRWFAFAVLALAVAGCSGTSVDPRNTATTATFAASSGDPGCYSPTLVSTGGAFPRDPSTLAIRWTGFSNFELAYNGQILLLDAYIDRGAIYPSLGFRAADVKRANAILIGHGHFDHMSDAAQISRQTGAPVVGGPVTAEKLQTQDMDKALIRSVTGLGGEVLQFGSFRVEPILGRHGQPPREIVAAFDTALKATAPQPTPAQIEEQRVIMAKGTFDPRVIGEGTIAYFITLDNGFRIMYRDSGGVVTEQEKAAMQRIGRVDLALVAVAADFVNNRTIERALEHMRTYRPDVYMPAHHDAAVSSLWRATEPIFQALKDENPKLVTVSRSYREPVCFDTRSNLSRGG